MKVNSSLWGEKMPTMDLKVLKESYVEKFPNNMVSTILSTCPDEIGPLEFLVLARILIRAADLSQSIGEWKG